MQQTCAGCGEEIEREPGATFIREEVATLMRMEDGTCDLVAPAPETNFWCPACWEFETKER